MVLDESFEVHDTLNPLLWDKNDKLLPEVKSKIIAVVEQFKNAFDFNINVLDVMIIGSNASYNYTKNSDLDVHIITNFNDLDASTEITTLLFNQLKTKFNATYDISIHGIPIEVYVEDVNVSATSNGIYSVYTDKWLKFPKKLTSVTKYDLSKELSTWVPRITAAINSGNPEFIQQIVNTLYLLRKNSILVNGEYSKGNQLFKEIRDSGLLQQLKDAYNETISKQLSLEHLDEDVLEEDSRTQLINKTKSSTSGKKRYLDRVKSKITASVKQYNSIDMNKLFKDNILTVDIDVKGESDTYTVKISFGGFLDILHDQLKKENSDTVDLRMITRALITGFNRNDVYIHCSCPDFKYTYDYYATRNSINSGEPENIPSKERNPEDKKGSGCKHIMLVLSNTFWIIKVATVVYNYIKYMKDHYDRLYKTIIYPAVYNKEYVEEEPEEEAVEVTEETPVTDETTEKTT